MSKLEGIDHFNFTRKTTLDKNASSFQLSEEYVQVKLNHNHLKLQKIISLSIKDRRVADNIYFVAHDPTRLSRVG